MAKSEGEIDAVALEAVLSSELDAAVTDTEVLHDGLNLSVAISTAEEGRAYVLRRPNKFRDRESFLDVEREYEVLRRLRDTAVPAPEPVALCEDESVLGGPALVMTHLEGEAIPLGDHLPERFRNESARETLAHRLVDALAELHSVDVGPFADVCERRPPREQVDRVAAQLDEATAFLGDPLTELGYLLLRWRDDGDPTPSLDGIAARHSEAALEGLRVVNERGLAPFTNEPGSPSRRELVARYEDATGLDYRNDRFYRALAAFVLATVWEDLHRYRVEAGEESGMEPHVEYLSAIATSIVGGEVEV